MFRLLLLLAFDADMMSKLFDKSTAADAAVVDVCRRLDEGCLVAAVFLFFVVVVVVVVALFNWWLEFAAAVAVDGLFRMRALDE